MQQSCQLNLIKLIDIDYLFIYFKILAVFPIDIYMYISLLNFSVLKTSHEWYN